MKYVYKFKGNNVNMWITDINEILFIFMKNKNNRRMVK